MGQNQCQTEFRAEDWCYCNTVEKFEPAIFSFGAKTTHGALRCFTESDKNMQMYVKLFFQGDEFNFPVKQ